MKVIIAGDGDHIGREVGRASLADDIEGLRRISQVIDQGNRLWESWVHLNGGAMISFGGDEFRAEIQASKLAELPKIRDQYAKLVGSTVSIGVGTKLSEADKALLVAKHRGGDSIVLWTEDLNEEMAAITKKKDGQSEDDKLAEAYLNKAIPGQPAENEGAQAGFAGASQPSAPSVEAPMVEASEHSQGEAAQNMMDNDNPPSPEATSSATQYEDEFHRMASDQKAKEDAQGQPQPGSSEDQVRQQVVQVLQALKQQMPILEQIKGTAPDTYKAIMGLAQSVIMMARTMNGAHPEQTGQREIQDRAASQAMIDVPLPPEEEGEKEDTKKSELAKAEEKESDLTDCDQFGHIYGSGETTDHCLMCAGTREELEEKELDKASLSATPKTPPQHHHLHLPVGSHVDPGPTATRHVGKIKVSHVDTQGTKEGWIEARAGQVLSQDGHAISSRNPGGK